MKKLLLLLIGLISFSFLNAQDFEWAKSTGGSGFEHAYAIALDNSGNAYITGTFTGMIDFDPGPGTDNYTSAGGDDIFISKYDSLGNYIWTKQIGGAGNDGNELIGPIQGSSLTIDTFGNIYKTGYFEGTIDIDPGPSVNNLISFGGRDCFILKLDSLGNFDWVAHYGSAFSDQGSLIETDVNGNAIIKGEFSNTIDFDPGPGIFNLTTSGGSSHFHLKLDIAGNFIWAYKMRFTGSPGPTSQSLNIGTSGNFYTSGYFNGTDDFDPVGTYTISTGAASNGFIAKYDTTGNFVWAKAFLGSSEGKINSSVTDLEEKVYSTGYFEGTTDFDPSGGTTYLTSGGMYDGFISKIDSSGNLVWVKQIIGAHPANTILPYFITTDTSGYLYITGTFFGPYDFDPGPGIHYLAPASTNDIFILKLDSNGNFVWAKSFTGTSTEICNSLKVNSTGDIYLTGGFNDSIDFDPAPPAFDFIASGGDMFVAKLSQGPCSNLTLTLGLVSNLHCDSSGYAIAQALTGTSPFTYIWNTVPPTLDSIALFPAAGIYQITVTDASACSKSAEILIEGPSTPAGFDFNINLVATTFRTGLLSHLWIEAFNDGCIPQNGQISIVIDDGCILNSTIPSPDLISGDTLSWNFSSITYDSSLFVPQIFVTPTSVILGSYVCFKTIITPFAGDADTTNNIKDYCYPIVNSYDPNDKKAYPIGECEPAFISNDQLLNYTVRFQNTGTAEAIDIYVLDTLDSDLDLNTVRILAHSHPMHTEVLPGNVLKFVYDSIMLPDSTSNEAGSHGYVIFEIMPNAGLANGIQITNDVGIYFDFNPPVYTNTVLNTISDFTIDNSTSVSGITITAGLSGGTYQWVDCDNGNSIISGETLQSYTPTTNGNYAVIISDGCFTDTSSCVTINIIGINESSNTNSFSVSPNPSQNTITVSTQKTIELNIVNVLGETVLKTNAKDKDVIDVSGLSNGIYFIRSEEGKAIRLIKQ